MDAVKFVEGIEYDVQIERIEAKLSDLRHIKIEELYREYHCDHLRDLAHEIYNEYKEHAQKAKK